MTRVIAMIVATALAATMYVVFAQGDVPNRLVLGMVPREAALVDDSLGPIADMLSERLLIPVGTFVSTDSAGLVEAVGNGRVDIALFGPADLVQTMDMHGARVILASVRHGSTTYRSQFNVRCDRGLDDFEDLRGGTIAFVDRSSMSDYQFPYVSLMQRGINPDTEMTRIFAGSHDAAALAVYDGDVDVAVTFGGSPGSDGREAIARDFPDVKDVVCILGYSDDIPNDGAVVRAGIDPEFADQIAQALIDIAETEEGRVHTEALFDVTAFARIDPEMYDAVREVLRTFRR